MSVNWDNGEIKILPKYALVKLNFIDSRDIDMKAETKFTKDEMIYLNDRNSNLGVFLRKQNSIWLHVVSPCQKRHFPNNGSYA